jgi:glycosyltransferase involved in cell wall biosynthesis
MNTDPVSVPQHSLTVIVPAYNEADRLQLTLEQLVAASWLREKQGGIIVVDDGSTDSSAAFDAELLFLAQRTGLKVAEVAVSWQENSRSKVRLLRDGTWMLLDLLRVRWWALIGAYEEK